MPNETFTPEFRIAVLLGGLMFVYWGGISVRAILKTRGQLGWERWIVRARESAFVLICLGFGFYSIESYRQSRWSDAPEIPFLVVGGALIVTIIIELTIRTIHLARGHGFQLRRSGGPDVE